MNQELTITLLDKTLSVACPPGQESALLESAQLLNEQMLKVQLKKPSASLLEIIGALDCFQPALGVLDTNLFGTPEDLEGTVASLRAKARLLKLDLHLGTDAETTLVFDESRLRLTPRQPDAQRIYIVHSLAAWSNEGGRHCNDTCVRSLWNIGLQLVKNQEGRLSIRNRDG